MSNLYLGDWNEHKIIPHYLRYFIFLINELEKTLKQSANKIL